MEVSESTALGKTDEWCFVLQTSESFRSKVKAGL